MFQTVFFDISSGWSDLTFESWLSNWRAGNIPGKSQQGMNTSSQLVAMRQYLDPWAKIYFLGLVSLIFGDKAQGFLSLQSAFFSSMQLASKPFAFPLLMENTQQYHPGSMSYLSPTFIKCNWEGKEKHLYTAS